MNFWGRFSVQKMFSSRFEQLLLFQNRLFFFRSTVKVFEILKIVKVDQIDLQKCPTVKIDPKSHFLFCSFSMSPSVAEIKHTKI